MALVSVPWGVALLFVIATSLLATGNISYRLARNGVELSQSDAAHQRTMSLGTDVRLPNRLHSVCKHGRRDCEAFFRPLTVVVAC
jgi:hypothetical protein